MNYDRFAIIGVKDKGGVGLSTALTAMATVLIATGGEQFSVQLVDADGFNGTLTQWCGQRDAAGKLLAEQDPNAGGVIKADLFKPEGVRPMFSSVESEARHVIIDTPAGALTKFDELSRNLKARDFIDHSRAHGRRPIVVIGMTPAVASIRGVGRAIDSFGEDVDYIAVRNMVGNTPADYRLWSTQSTTNRYGREVGGRVRPRFEAVGGRLIDAPVAEPGTFAIAEALGLCFSASAQYAGPGWQGMDRLNMRNWLHAWMAELQQLEDLLGLKGVEWRAF